ncbi:DUF2490 domain-containing protein [Flavobacterium silvisoli]|uniref:DUF2490 domain-containing protein n=1 Tax=Flavobacterium silvisoli TaxID=2529433 RepID=A0A4Q9Z010_9FLAO|nr:DUF2490 domain-containing protein [Flavobacterium silvisoli]TBX69587.1 DUF2490 domain-containing protein [Flavobacterium silvisoli]
MRKVLLLFGFLLVSNLHLNAQSLKQDQRVWFAYAGQYKVAEHWGYHIEAQFRMDNQLEQNLQNLYRIGAVYFISSTKNLTAGYALVNTFDTGKEHFFKENRIWEQYQYTKKWHADKNMMLHRLRLEQRWVGSLGTVDGNVVSMGSNYQNRLRYFNRNLFHIANLKATDEEIYAVLQNEIFINLGDNKVNSNVFDQNRFLIGLGLNYNNHIRLELGYMNHFVNSNAKVDTMNHTVSISLIQNLNLQKQ